MLLRITLAFILYGLLVCAASAQSFPRAGPGPDERRGSSNRRPELGSPEEEMMARREIKSTEKSRKENLERAREAAELAAELRETYKQNKSLAPTDIKKLERLEKLTRRIRSAAGGSDGDVKLEKVPQQLESALERVAEVSEEMRKSVEDTPRYVISVAVIEHANELMEMLRYVRTHTR